MAKVTKNEFLRRCIAVYDDKYDYSKTNYINSDTKVVITCYKHGDFEKSPLKFLNGRECSECKKEDGKRFGNTRKLNTEEFIKRSKDIFGDEYNYSKVEYKNYKTKVILSCSTHGDFEIVPNYHLSDKSGCQKCAKEVISAKNTMSQSEFIKRAIEVHGDKYDYSKIEYTDLKCKINLECGKHGEFEIGALHHIHNEGGCQRCGREIASSKTKDTFNDFILKANKKHKNKYNYSLSIYTNSRDKIKITCNKHGVFEQSPAMHISGQGCPICKESFGEREIRNWLQKNNIKFEYQKKFDECKNKRHLPFDFYLPEQNLCIEFNGSQHYKVSAYFGNESFQKTQINDEIKRKFCKENEVQLLIIKYDNNIYDKLKHLL